jgi:hypothetical protein
MKISSIYRHAENDAIFYLKLIDDYFIKHESKRDQERQKALKIGIHILNIAYQHKQIDIYNKITLKRKLKINVDLFIKNLLERTYKNE